MVDERDKDDSFIQEFLARAKKREAKLANINDIDSESDKGQVSYPPLSPLPEEEDDRSLASDARNARENLFPENPDLNYSSDLSLDCDDDEVYRAEPVMCDSSPEQSKQQKPQSPQKEYDKYSDRISERLTVELTRQPEQKAASSQSLPANLTDEQVIKNLKLKADRAEQTKNQLKKLVEISKYGSNEHIEAARLLQITDTEHLTYTNHVAMMEKGIKRKSESLGSLKLSGLRLKLSSKLRNDLAEEGVSHYFFCIAICGTEVKATEVIDTDDIRRQDLKMYLEFKEKISFVDLPPDFVVKLEVYELATGQHMSKFLSILTPSKRTKITLERNFRRVGSLRLTLSDRDVTYKNLLQWSKHEESKYVERECKFSMELKSEQLPSKAGMLHVRSLDKEGRPDWSRFWVDLSDARIGFWKSKQDALDGKKANQVIEFTELCAESVQKLTPHDELYRQHSFVLYSIQQVVGGEKDNLFQQVLKDEPKFKLVKHQFATESKDDRDSWCSLLDRSIRCYREWHGKTRIYPFDELREMFSPSY